MLGLFVARADGELEPTTREVIHGHRELGEHPRRAMRVAAEGAADADTRGRDGHRRLKGPPLEDRAVGAGVADRRVQVEAPQVVESRIVRDPPERPQLVGARVLPAQLEPDAQRRGHFAPVSVPARAATASSWSTAARSCTNTRSAAAVVTKMTHTIPKSPKPPMSIARPASATPPAAAAAFTDPKIAMSVPREAGTCSLSITWIVTTRAAMSAMSTTLSAAAAAIGKAAGVMAAYAAAATTRTAMPTERFPNRSPVRPPICPPTKNPTPVVMVKMEAMPCGSSNVRWKKTTTYPLHPVHANPARSAAARRSSADRSPSASR